jgi:hypothetical protein
MSEHLELRLKKHGAITSPVSYILIMCLIKHIHTVKTELFRNQIIGLGMDGGAQQSESFFTLPFNISSCEQMKKGDEWRLIVQEAKAHPEL